MGTQLQNHELDIDADFQGLEGCNEILNVTRPGIVGAIHRSYFAAGADLVETNTFGCNLTNLADYDIADRCYELAKAGAEIARGVVDEFTAAAGARPRFVLGALGPGTKLPSLGQVGFDELQASYEQAARGLIDGGVDGFLVETAQDVLQLKAVIGAIRHLTSELPIICHVTVETTGTMLLGTEIAAALTALEPLNIQAIGLNCATGPTEMTEHLRYLVDNAAIPVTVMPNAGLPELGPTGAVYPLGPDQFVREVTVFVDTLGLRMVGGCCGTTPEHIAQLRAAVDAREDVAWEPTVSAGPDAVSSIYAKEDFTHPTGITIIGERANANGSKAFKEAMLAEDWQTCLSIAKNQTRDGAHLIDVCVDYVGRDGAADMATFAAQLATATTLPIMVDSTEPAVIEAGLKALGGRCVVNSVNFEDPARFHTVMKLVKEFGAVVVALVIDEDGMARTADTKVAVAERLITAIKEYGLDDRDIIVDALTFPISTGQVETRRDGIETLEAIKRLSAAHPHMHFTLGISNVSFGLNPPARQVLNSVFLAEAISVGLDTAIVNSQKILPLNRIDATHLACARDMIYDRRGKEGTYSQDPDYDPLQTFMAFFADVNAAELAAQAAEQLKALPVKQRLAQRIIDGEKDGLEADLDEALQEQSAVEIINENLLEGMKTVGELFGSGQMQLPFVLQSAETMKAAVAYLEPFMEKLDSSASKGTIVIATVKGDVHDIGKNLVDIILTNNGYNVINIGIKQPISAIIEAAEKHQADAIGMSGLLVKSAAIMKDNLIALNEAGLSHYDVYLGGAALTRGYVEDDLASIYDGNVYYNKDAFEALRILNGEVGVDTERRAARQARREKAQATVAARTHVWEGRSPEVDPNHTLATPPFWGTKIIKGVSVNDVLPFMDTHALFRGLWGLRPARGSDESFEDLAAREGYPRLRHWLDELKTAGATDHLACVYGYFPVVSEGNDVIVLEEPTLEAAERVRFSFPRQARGKHLCLADYICSRERAEQEGRVDVLPIQLVTAGGEVSTFTNQYFERGDYRDYLELHGIAVQLAEAFAEYWHWRIRQELGIPETVSTNPRKWFELDYVGARYSFGYGSCPDLSEREKVVALLEPERIGVTLSEGYQLHPEEATDALVMYHPQARYFNV